MLNRKRKHKAKLSHRKKEGTSVSIVPWWDANLEDSRFRDRSMREHVSLLFAQEVEEIRSRSFFQQLLKRVYIHLVTYLPTYPATYLPTQIRRRRGKPTYVSVGRNIQFGLMPQSVTPRSCFHTKQRNPSRRHRRRYFLLSRSLARRRSHPFPFHLPSIAASAKRGSTGVSGRVLAGRWWERLFSRWPLPRNRHTRKCINLISLNSDN